ncbi:MAG: hypothetical protein F9K29_17120 [Hyphomicrobiaceae bacterium]|nr:MAG: hypothetical protein F9K29_17120 [Hyphomicrobiaceae bacterium]
MSTLLRFSLIATAAAFAFAATTRAPAQAPAPPSGATPGLEAVPNGTYQPFTVMQKIRLGATALVNPAVAEAATVVYGFEPNEVFGTAAWNQDVSSKISSGRVQFGRSVGVGAQAKLMVDQSFTKDVAAALTQEGYERTYYIHQGKFLSTQPTLGGALPSGAWIAWSPPEARK